MVLAIFLEERGCPSNNPEMGSGLLGFHVCLRASPRRARSLVFFSTELQNP